LILKQIASDHEAREFLNSVPYPEFWPDWLPVNTPYSLVLGVYDPDLVGAFILQKFKSVIEIHPAFVTSHRGKYAVNAGKMAVQWVWSNTPYQKIIAELTDRRAAVYARLCGFKKHDKYYEVLKWAKR